MTSQVDGDLTPIETGPCGLTWGEDPVGHTMDGVRFTVTPDLRKRTVDETGSHAVELIYQGESIEISTTVAEKTIRTLALVYPYGYQIDETTWGWGRLPGVRGGEIGRGLRIHPLERLADESHDVIFGRTVVSASNEVQFGVITADRVFAITWTALPEIATYGASADGGNPRYLYGYVGIGDGSGGGDENVAPVIGVPAAQSVAEDGVKTFSSVGGNPVTVSDEDGDPVTTTLAVDHGVLNLPSSVGLTFNFGDGIDDPIIEVVGTPAATTTALNGMTYEPDQNFVGEDTLTITVTDGTLEDQTTVTITVTPVNDTPTVTTTGGATAYTENGSALVVDGGITCADVDGGTFTGATAQITTGHQSAEDTLAVVTQNGISGSWNSGTGILTLTGTASIANYQASLRLITYANSSNDPSETSRVVTFKVHDGTAESAGATKTVTIAAVNDAPVLTTSGGTTEYTENGTALEIDAGITVTDADHAELGFGTVEITTGYQDGEDVLSVEDANGISGSWNSSTGVLTLVGTASTADWQAILRTVKYENALDNPTASTRVISFLVTDGVTDSNIATKNVSVAAVNDAPIVTCSEGAQPFTEGDAATPIDTEVTITDVDGATLVSGTVAITSGYAAEDSLEFTNQNGISGSYDDAGTLTLTGSSSVANWQTALRTVKYANSSESPSEATRVISFQVNDGTDSSNVATKDVSVTPVDDAAVLTASEGDTLIPFGSPSVTVDTAITISDVDGTTIDSAEVWFGTGFTGGEDSLSLSPVAGITGSWDGFGLLTLSGSGTISEYQTALQSVVYENSNSSPDTTDRIIVFKTTTGGIDSNTVMKTIRFVGSVTGGEIFDSGGYRHHFFDSSGSLVVGGFPKTMEAFAIGGGGGGGDMIGGGGAGGGGGGGFLHTTSPLEFAPQTINITIGAGGTGGVSGNGANGEGTVIDCVETPFATAQGGGGGASPANSEGAPGGCGGGARGDEDGAAGGIGAQDTIAPIWTGLGFSGGSSTVDGVGAGGGGIGGPGGDESGGASGGGGPGITFWGEDYGGGGGGSSTGTGGSGWGSVSGSGSSGSTGGNGAANRGGGGGGGEFGGSGGSGRVGFRYPI